MRRFLLALSLFVSFSCATGRPDAESFDWALGDWQGVRVSEGGSLRAPMTIRVENLPGGTGQIERMQVQHEPRPYFSVTVRDRDRETGQWVMVYTNPARPKISRLLGTVEERGRIAFFSVTTDPSRGSKFVSERVGTDQWRRTQYVSEDAGRTWKVLFVDELERPTAER